MKPLEEPDEQGRNHDLVVIGASAGGVEVLKRLVSDLPEDLHAAVCIVLHMAPASPSALAGILERSGPLPCRFAGDDGALHFGEIVVAPPDRHMVVQDGRVKLTVGPRENGHRPAIDVLFRSAAAAREGRVIGVVLTGSRDDGTLGLAVIKEHGGAAVVQSPDDATYPAMPSSALALVAVDAVAPADRIGATIAAIVNGEQLPEGTGPSAPPADPEVGDRLTGVCPECGGVLTELAEDGVARWECHVGHRYSPASFADAQAQNVEAALWTATRALRDRGALLRRLAEQTEGRGQSRSAQSFRRQSEDAYRQAELILDTLRQAAASTLREVSELEADEAAAEQVDR